MSLLSLRVSRRSLFIDIWSDYIGLDRDRLPSWRYQPSRYTSHTMNPSDPLLFVNITLCCGICIPLAKLIYLHPRVSGDLCTQHFIPCGRRSVTNHNQPLTGLDITNHQAWKEITSSPLTKCNESQMRLADCLLFMCQVDKAYIFHLPRPGVSKE